jgi:hypothetical protein
MSTQEQFNAYLSGSLSSLIARNNTSREAAQLVYTEKALRTSGPAVKAISLVLCQPTHPMSDQAFSPLSKTAESPLLATY